MINEITCRLELQRPSFDLPSAPLLQPRSARVAPDLDCAKLCIIGPIDYRSYSVLHIT